MATRDVATEVGRSERAVRLKAAKLGLRKIGRPGYRPNPEARRYPVPDSLFRPLDAVSAYVIGLITSDGCLKNGDRFDISNTDRALLTRACAALGLRQRPSPPDSNGGSRVTVCSRAVYTNLTALGLTERKSLTCRMPAVSPALVGHFLRGFFDGDGAVRFGRRGGLVVKFTSGSRNLLVDVAAAIEGATGLAARSPSCDKNRAAAWRIYYYGPKALRLAQLMYRDCGDLFMRRKRKVFAAYEGRGAAKPS